MKKREARSEAPKSSPRRKDKTSRRWRAGEDRRTHTPRERESVLRNERKAKNERSKQKRRKKKEKTKKQACDTYLHPFSRIHGCSTLEARMDGTDWVPIWASGDIISIIIIIIIIIVHCYYYN